MNGVELRWIRKGEEWTLQYRCRGVNPPGVFGNEWSPWITVPFMAPDK